MSAISQFRSTRLMKMCLALTLVLATALSASGVAQAAGPPGTRNFKLCRTIMFTAHASRTYTGTIYSRLPNSVMQYWVRTKNVNVLGWLGSVTVGGHYDRFLMPPFGSRWTYSQALFPANVHTRAYRYSITVSPDSDASALGLELWAPSCV
jgi:hypothetical protein